MSEAITAEQALEWLESLHLTDEAGRITPDKWPEAQAAARAIRAALPREGWKLVPVEPDENMVYAEDDSISPSEARKRRAIIRAAIAAAPPTQEEQE